eukprot:2385202-Rhodomonas_salina.1
MALLAYGRAMRCPVLTPRLVLSAYGPAMQCPVLTLCFDVVPVDRVRAAPGTNCATSYVRSSMRCL